MSTSNPDSYVIFYSTVSDSYLIIRNPIFTDNYGNTKEKINLSECINQSLQIDYIGIPSISEEKRAKCLQVRLLIIHVSFGSRKSCVFQNEIV